MARPDLFDPVHLNWTRVTEAEHPMSSNIALYEALASAPDERARAKVIAEAFEQLDERYPHLADLATQGHVRESELRLQREIEKVRAELKVDIEQLRTELKLDIAHVRAEVEQLRAELRESELRLQKEIEQVRTDLSTRIETIKVDLLRWLLPLMLAQVAAIAAMVKLL